MFWRTNNKQSRKVYALDVKLLTLKDLPSRHCVVSKWYIGWYNNVYTNVYTNTSSCPVDIARNSYCYEWDLQGNANYCPSFRVPGRSTVETCRFGLHSSPNLNIPVLACMTEVYCLIGNTSVWTYGRDILWHWVRHWFSQHSYCNKA